MSGIIRRVFDKDARRERMMEYLDCCINAKNFIKWREQEHSRGPDADGFCINVNEDYPDPAWEIIYYCPFCGKKIEEDKI